jgi:hypothetical protein
MPDVETPIRRAQMIWSPMDMVAKALVDVAPAWCCFAALNLDDEQHIACSQEPNEGRVCSKSHSDMARPNAAGFDSCRAKVHNRLKRDHFPQCSSGKEFATKHRTNPAKQQVWTELDRLDQIDLACDF